MLLWQYGLFEIINRTNWISVVFKNVHILSYYTRYDYKEEEEDYNHRHPEYMWKWILEHLAKLEFLNFSIHPTLQEFIQNHTHYKSYFTKCIQELKTINDKKLQNSWINFLNLLVDDRIKLKNYAWNQNLVQDYKNND